MLIVTTSSFWALGCDEQTKPGLVIATTWPTADRRKVESICRSRFSMLPPIEWVTLESGEALRKTIDRRGGVDLILGAPVWEFERLAHQGKLIALDASHPFPWCSVVRDAPRSGSFWRRVDPRDDPNCLAEFRAILQAEGWPKGYERLVRQAMVDRKTESASLSARPSRQFREGLAIVEGGRNVATSRRVVEALEAVGIAHPSDSSASIDARADVLLAELLGASLVDAAPELRDASSALIEFRHPQKAEISIGERPPWPPASVLKLREQANGEALVETLLEQIAPDRDAREWLRINWSEPRRPVDGVLLREIAGAAHGRLVDEPRFRAWLRGEWTAWTRQLYRRVARLARGYVPS